LLQQKEIVGIMSHPARVRGLKPIAGSKVSGANLSHPARVRGLKPFVHAQYLPVSKTSHPARVRGLKPNTQGKVL